MTATERFLSGLNLSAFWFLVLAALVSVAFVIIAWLEPGLALALVAAKVIGPF